ncbi:hypothetical protein [Methanobrevibacter sp.]|uniref:hypothetical protein n=1 Tax=Methanobrevibacter sp. TaxID=66852 RepID=UPI0025E841FC|nr:hypothetical protein [Methanobrevibacter sp.]MBQ2831645.1 hypothetical protein [Methanobrevibacter sp.]
MKLLILGADTPKEMKKISEELSQKKFKLVDEDKNFILMRKRRYGNLLIHAICLIIALSSISFLIFVNVGYFMYSYIWASPNVLITTEKVSEEGEPLEFSDMDEVLNKANAIL